MAASNRRPPSPGNGAAADAPSVVANGAAQPSTANAFARPATVDAGAQRATADVIANTNVQPPTANAKPQPAAANAGPRPTTCNANAHAAAADSGAQPATANAFRQPAAANAVARPGVANADAPSATANIDAQPATANADARPAAANADARPAGAKADAQPIVPNFDAELASANPVTRHPAAVADVQPTTANARPATASAVAQPADASADAQPVAANADARRWLALGFIALAQLMVALDATVVNIALPTAQTSLRFSDSERQWVISAYTLAFGGLLLLGGRIADSARIGRRRAFLTGLVGFAVASALSGAAANLEMLVAARALQGAFAALLAPAALSMLSVLFGEPGERARAFGIYGGIAASGGAIGLLLGGLLTQYFDWRWCLYVNVPIALLAALGARAVFADARSSAEELNAPPMQRRNAVQSSGAAEQPNRSVHGNAGPSSPAPSEQHAPRFDILGLLLGSGGLVLLVTGFGQAATQGWTAPAVLALLATGAISLGLFITQEARTEAPLLPLRIVFDRQRGGAYLSALMAVGGMFGAFLFLTYDLQVVLGLSPVQAGLAFLPMSASSLLVATVVAPRLVPRVAPRVFMVPGFLMAAAGMGLLTQLHVDSSYLVSVLPAEILLGLGISCVMVPAASLATSGVDRRDAGIASATLNTAQQIGASLGTAVLNTVAASVTATYLSTTASATRADGLVHGYAAAAAWGAMLLIAGAITAACLSNRPRTQSVH